MVDAVNLACPYCGQRDQLPADVALRSIDLRARIEAARAALARLDGFTLAMAKMYESRGGALRVALPMTALCGAMLASNLTGALDAAQRAPEALRACLLANGLASSSLLWAAPLGVVCGLALARWRYRRGVRPWLLARAPQVEGAPARCRVCGAGLATDAREVFAACRYCRAQNLLVGEVYEDRARRLADEQRFHHDRASGASAAASRVGAGLDRVLTGSVVGGWVLTLVLTAVAQRLVCGWR